MGRYFIYQMLLQSFLFACSNHITDNEHRPLKKRIWTEFIYSKQEGNSNRIRKVEYYNPSGVLFSDTLFYKDDLGFRANVYNNGLNVKSVVVLDSITTTHLSTYDEKGSAASQVVIRGVDTTYVDFINSYDSTGILAKTIAKDRSTKNRIRVEYEYADTLVKMEKQFLIEKEIENLTKIKANYYNEKNILISQSVKELQSRINDSTCFYYDESNRVSKSLTYSDHVLYIEEGVEYKNGEEVITIFNHLQNLKFVRKSESTYW